MTPGPATFMGQPLLHRQATDFRPKRRIRLVWTCSNGAHHEHRWRWAAWLCGRIQSAWERATRPIGAGEGMR